MTALAAAGAAEAAAAIDRRLRQLAARAGDPAVATPISAIVALRALDPIRLYAAATALGADRALWLQPRAGFGLLAVGSAWTLEPAGSHRFAAADRTWSALAGRALVDGPGGIRATGPVLVGGFGFASEPALSHTWRGFASARLAMPALLVTWNAGEAWLTATAIAGGDRPPAGDGEEPAEPPATRPDPGELWERLLAAATDPVDHAPPSGALRVALEEPPAPEWRASVARLAGAVGRGRIDKVVLARRLDLVADRQIDVAAALRRLEAASPESTLFAFARGQRTFLGATPERLIRVEDREYATVALAGSSRRGRDAAEDERLGLALLASEKDREEHAIVVAMIREALEPISERLHMQAGPSLARLRHVQHLATALDGRLRSRIGILALVERLHPTPAVGGSPGELALLLLGEEERIERGWYAGPIGWLDARGDGEFAVALRSGMVGGRDASLFAGCGIVADSDPDREWDESLIKLSVLASALGAWPDGAGDPADGPGDRRPAGAPGAAGTKRA